MDCCNSKTGWSAANRRNTCPILNLLLKVRMTAESNPAIRSDQIRSVQSIPKETNKDFNNGKPSGHNPQMSNTDICLAEDIILVETEQLHGVGKSLAWRHLKREVHRGCWKSMGLILLGVWSVQKTSWVHNSGLLRWSDLEICRNGRGQSQSKGHDSHYNQWARSSWGHECARHVKFIHQASQ